MVGWAALLPPGTCEGHSRLENGEDENMLYYGIGRAKTISSLLKLSLSFNGRGWGGGGGDVTQTSPETQEHSGSLGDRIIENPSP